MVRRISLAAYGGIRAIARMAATRQTNPLKGVSNHVSNAYDTE